MMLLRLFSFIVILIFVIVIPIAMIRFYNRATLLQERIKLLQQSHNKQALANAIFEYNTFLKTFPNSFFGLLLGFEPIETDE